jgi:uroporphyrinogen decarboxylase
MPDPEQSGRMPELLKALRILHDELRDTVPIVGCVVGPLTLTAQLVGLEAALYMAVDQPERFVRLMDLSTQLLIRFGLAQLSAGAHVPVIFDPAASPAVVPPQFFHEFELPQLAKLFTAFKQAGALFNWLHIAGPAQSILPYYAPAGVDVANLDYYVMPEIALEQLPRTCVDGNLKSLAFVESEPSEIQVLVKQLLRAFAPRGGFILSSGCEIPPEAKPENVAALVMAAHRAE